MKSALTSKFSACIFIKFCTAVVLFSFPFSSAIAATYYVDTNSTGSGSGTTTAISGPNAAWKNISEITGLQPGDAVYFKRAQTWTESLQITVSGTDNAPITFDAYGAGEKPLIDLSNSPSPSGFPYSCCISVGNQNYIVIKNFRLKGSGFGAAFQAYGTAGAAEGDDYTIKVYDVDVLSSFNAHNSSVAEDGFDLTSSAQVEFHNITATKCRRDPADTDPESNQCLTLHTSCKAKVYTANFSDSCNWIVNTADTYCEVYDLTATSGRKGGVIATNDATSDFYLLVSDSNLTADAGSRLFIVSSDASKEGPRIVIQDSHLNFSNSQIHLNYGNINLLNNVIEINDSNWRIEHYEGILSLQGNHIICNDTADSAAVFTVSNPGSIDFSSNLFEIGEIFHSVLHFNSQGQKIMDSVIRNNIFKNVSGSDSVVRISDDVYAPVITNNVFYNSSSGGTAIDLEYDGDEDPCMFPGFSNNIFYNIADVIDCTDEADYTFGYNCYFGGEVLRGLGSIEADPNFVDASNNDFHLKSAGWRWDQENQTWTWDNITSRCIDAGNPGSLLRDELLNVPDDPANEWGTNVRINIGAYGGTSEASIGPADWAFWGDINNDGAVNFKDYGIQMNNWQATRSNCVGDLSRDGTVNLDDFDILKEDWVKQTIWLNSSEIAIPYDIDKSSVVDFSDFAIMAHHWLKDCSVQNNRCDGTDFVFNRRVDINDLSEFCQHWLEQKPE